MGKFARIIELDNDEQVLLTVNYKQDSDEYEVEVRTEFEGSSAKVVTVFKDKEEAEHFMLNLPQEFAVNFRQKMSLLLE